MEVRQLCRGTLIIGVMLILQKVQQLELEVERKVRAATAWGQIECICLLMLSMWSHSDMHQSMLPGVTMTVQGMS